MKNKIISIFILFPMILSLFGVGIDVKAVTKEETKQEENEESNFNVFGYVDNTDQDDPLAKSVDCYQSNLSVEDTVGLNRTLPSSVDNSAVDDEGNGNGKYFPEIIDQIGGSCASQATTYYQATYMINRELNRIADNDNNIFSPYWTYSLVNKGKNNGSDINECYEIMKKIGLNSMADVKLTECYDISDEYYNFYSLYSEFWTKAQKYKISSYGTLNLNPNNEKTPIKSPNDDNLYEIKKRLSEGEIFTFSTENYDKFNKNTRIIDNEKYSGNHAYAGQYIITRCDSKHEDDGSGHAMTIVGYDDNIWMDIDEDGEEDPGEMGAFKIANSHGKEAYNNGFMWLSYDALNEVSSVTLHNSSLVNSNRIKGFNCYNVYYMVPEVDKNDSKVYLRINLDVKNRSKLNINISSLEGNKSIIVPGFSNQYSCNIRGQKDKYSSGSITIDLNNIYKDVTLENVYSKGIKLKINDREANDDSITYIKSVQIIDGSNDSVYDNTILKQPIYLNGTSTSIDICSKVDFDSSNFNGKYNKDGSVSLAWNSASSKYGDIDCYYVYRDNKLMDIVNNNTYTDTFAHSGINKYKIVAYDVNGNMSDPQYVNVEGNKEDKKETKINKITLNTYNNIKVGEKLLIYCDYYCSSEDYDITIVARNLNRDRDSKVTTVDKNGVAEIVAEVAGDYHICAIIKEGDKVISTEDDKIGICSKYITISDDNYQITDISSDLESPQYVNKEINFNIKTSNSSNLLNYKAEITDEEGNKETLKSYDPNIKWVPKKSGNYSITFSAFDIYYSWMEGSKTINYEISNDEVSIDDISKSNYSNEPIDYVYLGEYAIFTVKARGGVTPYTYKFEYEKDGEYVDFTNDRRNNYSDLYSVFLNIGINKVKCTVTDNNGVSDSKIVNLEVKKPLMKIDWFSVDNYGAYPTPIELECNVKNAEGNIKYKYYYKEAGEDEYSLINEDYIYTNKYSFIPKSYNKTYYFKVEAIDEEGNYDSSENSVYVYGCDEKLTINNFSANTGNRIMSGNEVVFNAECSNNEGEVQYRYDYVNNTTGEKGCLRDFYPCSKLSWFTTTPGYYYIIVTAKDGDNEDSKQIEFYVDEYKEVSISSLDSSLGDNLYVGDKTEFTINATGGIINNGYTYSLEVNGTKLLNESEENKVKWTPESAGTYTITATAYDSRHAKYKLTKTIIVKDSVTNRYEDNELENCFNGTWMTQKNSKCSGGTTHVSSRKNAVFTTSFTGKGISIIASKNNTYGIMKVSVDGKDYYVDLYRTSKLSKLTVIEINDLEQGSHTLEVSYTGNKNENATGTYIALDAIDIIDGEIIK